jgi:hypothetical protein
MSIAETILTIEKQLKIYNHLVTEAAETILDNEVSNYPIFIATQDEIDMGLQIIDHETTTAAWSIYASTLEEFVAKQVVLLEKVDDFKKTYKDPREHNCYFIISKIGHQFAFLSSHAKPL